MAVKFLNVKKRMAVLKSVGNVKSGELVITRSKGDGSTIGVLSRSGLKPIWRTFSTEELRLAIDYVTMPVDEYKELINGK